MPIKVMVNGLPGKMATEVAEYVINNPDLSLVEFSLTGPEIEELSKTLIGENYIQSYLQSENHKFIHLIKPEYREVFHGDGLIKHEFPFISIDYTNPDAVNDNADFYCENKLPFVMGTTGGDRKALEERVKNSEICAVIAPNMAKQIVAFQAMMKYAAETFPGAFKDYKLEIVESHQKGKADTSGTAKAMVEYFNQLGIPFTKDQICMIRDPGVQFGALNVPLKYLDGHGWHTYTLKAKEENVLFQFTHNVNGRGIYAEGTIDAIEFLDKKIKKGEKGKVYSMIDVLKETI